MGPSTRNDALLLWCFIGLSRQLRLSRGDQRLQWQTAESMSLCSLLIATNNVYWLCQYSELRAGMSGSDRNWARLANNGQNLGFVKISFSTFWLTDLKVSDLSHFGPIWINYEPTLIFLATSLLRTPLIKTRRSGGQSTKHSKLAFLSFLISVITSFSKEKYL